MRKITVPSPIRMFDPLTGEPAKRQDPSKPFTDAGAPNLIDLDPVSFRSWAIQFVLSDKRFQADKQGWVTVARIMVSLNGDAESIQWEDADWELFKEVMDKPTQSPYQNAFQAALLLPFMEAVTRAESA